MELNFSIVFSDIDIRKIKPTKLKIFDKEISMWKMYEDKKVIKAY